MAPGHSAADLGILIFDILAIQSIFEAVVLGKPLIERTIALCGPGFKKNNHLKVRVGTPVEEIVKGRLVDGQQVRLIWDSPMAGEAITDLTLPVGPDRLSLVAVHESGRTELFPFARPGFKQDSFSNTFLSGILPFKRESNTNLHGEHRACISCGFCRDVCPVGILPQLLHRYVERNVINEKLLQYGIFHCIDCNLCTYVCLSKIPLAGIIEECKKKMMQEGFDRAHRDSPDRNAE